MSADNDTPAGKADSLGTPTRRTFLALGAVAASTVVTVRPALAQTAGSVLNCQIPIPQNVAPDGKVAPAGTAGAVKGAALSDEQAAMVLNGSTPPGVNPEATQAYANYIRRLQAGMSGFTCYASLQMQR